MGRGQDLIAREDAEIVRLEALSKSRALTRSESDRLAVMVMRQKSRHRRLAARIAAMRAKLGELEAVHMDIAA